jgi:hypothetical protein
MLAHARIEPKFDVELGVKKKFYKSKSKNLVKIRDIFFCVNFT